MIRSFPAIERELIFPLNIELQGEVTIASSTTSIIQTPIEGRRASYAERINNKRNIIHYKLVYLVMTRTKI